MSVNQSSITLEVPNEFSEVWLKDNYLDLLQDALTQASGRKLKIKFKIAEGDSVSPSAMKATKSRKAAAGRKVNEGDIIFNPRNTFETFVVGNNNSFAHAAALAVAQQPGKAYNPLFLYGAVKIVYSKP